MKLTHFKDINFLQAIKGLFKELKVPMNYVADEPTSAREILKDTYKDNATFALVDDVYFVGMVDDAAFEQNKSLAVDKIKSDYDGVLIFGITLHSRKNNLLPTRSQLAEISRAFNREFYYTPVVLVFKYKDDTTDYIAFANTERLKYKQAWREGEKAGKVSLLRDINIQKPHRGHEIIINQLKIPTSGKKQVDSFAKLYTYWQEVFSVNVLNKKFYQELSNWYFWAVKHVTFPNKPTKEVAHLKGVDLDVLIQEHNAKNVIRMLTRLLFAWFIKEKKLIPEALFDLDALQQDILKDISPYHDENSLFSGANQDSVYYKAILQNLFFATLNCPIDADGLDNRTRGFRGLETYGKHRGIDWMMRYKKYFKNPGKFLEMMNKTVPFLNGGLFECLDDKTQNLYIDGFSDQMTKGEKLVVPDYLFFGVEEKVDLSNDYGVKNKGAKEAAVKGLINILKSYKFTITENTPIEEDVALDPELLGKVFENLLASYNPETKTTARKQTGSFYTPREIVNYMVDESLIAYLKNNVENFELEEKQLDLDLHQLFSFDNKNPFEDNEGLQKQIIKALDKCTILDPACGSGAFPMGALQKMVHVLHKVDPNGQEWKQRQIDKVNNAIESLEEIEDSQIREQSIKDLELQKQDIEDAFENNELDYGRKLFLIENCIYGVDIQSIATQISKLRFFISLVVDQKIDPNKENFGIRPLPNLETKFVAANTLIGIDKPSDQLSLYDTKEVKALEKELKKIRHKLFSAKTKKTKMASRQKDEELRNAIAAELIKSGWANDTAEKLASWDPYDQNASSPFFDPEWMFDIKDGFDVVIGNPPYIGHKGGAKKLFQKLKRTNLGQKFNNERMDIFYYFFHISIDYTNAQGIISFITTNYFPTADSAIKLRKDIRERTKPFLFVDFNELTLFESARGQHNLLTFLTKNMMIQDCKILNITSASTKSERDLTQLLNEESKETEINFIKCSDIYDIASTYFLVKGISKESLIINSLLDKMMTKSSFLIGDKFEISQGIVTGIDKVSPKHVRKIKNYSNRLGEGVYVVDSEFISNLPENEMEIIKPWYKNSDIRKYGSNTHTNKYLIHIDASTKLTKYPTIYKHLLLFKDLIELRNYDSGELSKAKKTGAWWALSSSRRDFDFSTPKIISPQRSYNNTFGYTKSLWCASADVYFIKSKDDNYSILNLLLLLNSKLYYLWLFNRGKRKGDMLELYLTPISAIPIPNLSDSIIVLFDLLSNIQIFLASKPDNHNLFEDISNACIYEIFYSNHMQEKEIDVLQFIEKDIADVLQGRDFETLNDTEKEEVIEQLHKTWNHPDNEVRNRIKLFAVRSPEILKPILES